MVERQRRDLQSLQIKHYKRFHRVAKIKQARMFKQIVAALFIRWAVNRSDRPRPSAAGIAPARDPYGSASAKLLERTGRPAIGEIVQPGVDQGDCVVKLYYAAARWRRYCGERRALAQAAHSQPHAGTPCAPPVPVSVRVRFMLQRLREAEVALLVAFAQIETVCVVALHVGRKLGHFGPGPAGFFCPRQ